MFLVMNCSITKQNELLLYDDHLTDSHLSHKQAASGANSIEMVARVLFGGVKSE